MHPLCAIMPLLGNQSKEIKNQKLDNDLFTKNIHSQVLKNGNSLNVQK